MIDRERVCHAHSEITANFAHLVPDHGYMSHHWNLNSWSRDKLSSVAPLRDWFYPNIRLYTGKIFNTNETHPVSHLSHLEGDEISHFSINKFSNPLARQCCYVSWYLSIAEWAVNKSEEFPNCLKLIHPFLRASLDFDLHVIASDC